MLGHSENPTAEDLAGGSYEVSRNDERSRYELHSPEALLAIADYRLDGETVVFPHTEVVLHRRGQGLGERLVKEALDDVRRRGRRVRPLCWFVREYIEEHEQYRDLVA